MPGQVFNGCFFGAVLYDMPHRLLRYTASPGYTRPANTPKHATFAHASRHKPGIKGGFDPVRNGRRPDMPTFAHQINDGPAILLPLKIGDVQFCRFSPAQPAAQPDPAQRPISLTLERIRVKRLPERPCLAGREPVTKTNAEALRSFDSPDAGSEVRAEKAGISGLVHKPTDDREPAINGARRVLT